jgi:hypothetical protein
MNKNKFTVDIIPVNHFLIGFCYQTGILSEDHSVSFEEFSIGLGLINFNYIRFY